MSVGLSRGLVVSCQAEEGSPFLGTEFIVAFARAAELGGAAGLRLCGIENVRAVRAVTKLPIIGITKHAYPDGDVLITAGESDVDALVAAGADVVALDGTARQRPSGESSTGLLARLAKRIPVPLMADVATLTEGLAAASSGATYVGTTLSGYTKETRGRHGELPDLDLVAALARHLPGRVIAEGRIWTPEQARAALDLGAFAVVVGTAITRPIEITKRFARAMQSGR